MRSIIVSALVCLSAVVGIYAGDRPEEAAMYKRDALKQPVYKIMMVGDSITEGGSTFSVYRPLLVEQLLAAGYQFELLGSRQTNSRFGPLLHEGYSGKNFEYIAPLAVKSFENNPADIVLVHGAHNHFAEEKPIPGLIQSYRQFIQDVRAINPHVTVLLAQAILSGKLPKYEYIPEVNRLIAQLAAELDRPNQRVVLVNMAEDWDWTTDTIADQVHPNLGGATKMAKHWLTALQGVMEKPLETMAPQTRVYKTTAQGELSLRIFAQPLANGTVGARPAIVYYFGGGWSSGTPMQYYREAARLAHQGMVAVCVDYRISSVNNTSPFEAVADAKSALRWVRSHVGEFGIDPARIAAAGGSAGGHLAAACALLPDLDEDSDRSVSGRPDALLLFYPVLDQSPGGYGHNQVKDRWTEISPLDQDLSQLPPTLLLYGDKDQYVPATMVAALRGKAPVSRVKVKVYPGAAHPIFLYRQGWSELRESCMQDCEVFLSDMGWLKK